MTWDSVEKSVRTGKGDVAPLGKAWAEAKQKESERRLAKLNEDIAAWKQAQKEYQKNLDAFGARLRDMRIEADREETNMARAGFLPCGNCGRYVRAGFPFFGMHFC